MKSYILWIDLATDLVESQTLNKQLSICIDDFVVFVETNAWIEDN